MTSWSHCDIFHVFVKKYGDNNVELLFIWGYTTILCLQCSS